MHEFNYIVGELNPISYLLIQLHWIASAHVIASSCSVAIFPLYLVRLLMTNETIKLMISSEVLFKGNKKKGIFLF
jgi:hypothetical protein